MSDLKLIKKKVLSSEKNNFWKSCPRKLEYFPDKPCHLGIPDKDSKSSKEPECPWWINSETHNYCFWSFVRNKSDIDGSMKELVQSDLAKLFKWSSAKTHQYLQEAIQELKESFENHDLMSDLEDSDENYEMASISDLLNGEFQDI